MEKRAEEKPLSSLEEFIQSQQLVDWPVTCEENLESCSRLYSHSGELYRDLKARVQFPTDITESLQNNLETLQNQVKRHHSVLSGAPHILMRNKVMDEAAGVVVRR